MSAAASLAAGDDYEIVLVDDGSTDSTWDRMESCAAGDARVVAIRLSRNFGHQRALTAGLMHCHGALSSISMPTYRAHLNSSAK